MAVVQGIRERVHLPIYDSVTLGPGEQLGEELRGNMLRFFVDVQNKTKLQTNLQAASLLPHYNTFEARAMRVVISDLKPQFTEPNARNPLRIPFTAMPVVTDDGTPIRDNANPPVDVTADVELTLDQVVTLLREAEEDDDWLTTYSIFADDQQVTISPNSNINAVATANGNIEFHRDDLLAAIDAMPDDQRPLPEQLGRDLQPGSLMGRLIYNSVVTLYVGEKVMIQMPTWFFPAGAGVFSESPSFSANGEPNPTATFKFAEAVTISKQQNFRVELEFPDSETMQDLRRIYGPLHIWVVLDGYMERDVQ